MTVVYSNTSSPFYETYQLYRDYIGYSQEYSFSQWLRLPDRYKAAALYVQFYNEITLAWYKVKTSWAIEEEGVETINQYLLKNVEKISKDKKRFNPRYIYRVAYNCFYCICIDETKNKERYYNEVPESFSTNSDDECSWFDFVGQDIDFDDIREDEELSEFFDSLEDTLQCYIAYVLGELTDIQIIYKLKRLGKISGNTRNPEYRKKVLEDMKSDCTERLKTEVQIHFHNF